MSAQNVAELAAYESPLGEVLSPPWDAYTPPRDATETALAAVFAEVLGLEPGALSATESFFDLGGTSLDVIALKREIERRFAVSALDIGVVLQNPTVRALATRIVVGESHGLTDYDPVVPLQRSGGKTPLFCVHSGIGEVLGFVALAKYFADERPVYGLRARGFNNGEGGFTSFDELVFTYVEAIRRRQPRGPYAIMGYSYGGPVAFEIAKRLESRNERVAFVGCIDMSPRLMYLFDPVGCAVNLAFLLSLIDRRQAEELPIALRSGKLAPDACACLMEIASPCRLAELDLDLPRFRRWTEVAQNLLMIGSSYVPSGTVESVTVFYAHPVRGTKEDSLNNQLKRWNAFARGPNQYIDVPGEHYTLMSGEHVAGFQSALRGELDRALRGH
jgi:thioesterase domain-containing protein/acyl carrier protein